MDDSAKPEGVKEEEEFVDSASDSVLSEEWQDLSKSDYAKVIFCNLYHDPDNGEVGCKFQITDNVHEDPCDYVGLFKIGESQCLVSKMLSETECEEDGKLLRCVFAYEDLPSDLQDGFYQFQYITRDQEICGASTPFEVKQAQPKDDSSDEDIVTENAENDFVLVQHILEKKNRMLEQLLEKFRAKNLALSSDVETLLATKSKLCQEKEEIIENLHKEIISLKSDFERKSTMMNFEVAELQDKLKDKEKAASSFERELDVVAKVLNKCQTEKSTLQRDIQMLKEVVKDKESLPTESEQRILLEQLDDQKFMIRALEDSKQLALKEMSDLSESLSKRTKVLNQTRCELATCKGKVKESESIIEKQNQDISVFRERTKDLIECLDDKKDEIKKQQDEISRLNEEIKGLVKLLERTEARVRKSEKSVASRLQQQSDIAEEDVKQLLFNAFTEAEKYLALVDKIVEKVDFTDVSQEKAFYELKIMFFVLLGKMKKPTEGSNCKGNSSKKPQCLKEKQKKTASRTLPSCEGQTTGNSSCYSKVNNVFRLQRETSISTQNKEVQVCDELSASEADPASSSSFSQIEDFEDQLNELKAQVYTLNQEIAKKETVIEFISSEKVNLLKSELLLQETVREHAARITEAAELYKKQFVEIEKLKKKLRHTQRHSSKASTSKVIGYESSSTAEDVSPLRMVEKAPPTKRPRKTSLKSAEKTVSLKVGDRQPPMLKVLLRSYTKKAEKVASLKTKKSAKPQEKNLAFETAQGSNADEKVLSSQEIGTTSGSETISDFNQPATLNKLSFATLSKMVKDKRSENKSSVTEKPVPLRSISDSDTGEHVLRNSVLLAEGDKKQNVVASPSSIDVASEEDNCKQETVDKSPCYQPLYPKLDEVTPHSHPENPDLGTVQLLLNEEIARVKPSSSLCSEIDEEEESYDIPCVLCNKHFAVTTLSNVQLMDHLENEHQISMCPVCGQLFEPAVPKKYLEIHVNKHFQ
ncbi:hypothetical protein JTE90_000176 [Oedothorax gibbosus]|uniref:SKICH domain-containing protein n=1 Tax=Oedothorax gibbosus TaxID=931172 RepID=A0AAV6UT99_9ARAC|nr:hypothetical protein JTE90_000176 [Oedothorax gibbosus]